MDWAVIEGFRGGFFRKLGTWIGWVRFGVG